MGLRAAALLLAGACASYRPVPTGAAPRPSARVRVRYAAPAQLRAVSPRGDTLRLDGVRELTGELASIAGDTLVLSLRSVDRTPHPAAHVRVVPTAGDRIDVRRFDWDRSGLVLILGGLVGAYLLTVIAFSG